MIIVTVFMEGQSDKDEEISFTDTKTGIKSMKEEIVREINMESNKRRKERRTLLKVKGTSCSSCLLPVLIP